MEEEILDVDKFYKKYEVTEEDGIEAIDRNEYRQAKRRSRSKTAGQDRDRARSRSNAAANASAGPSTGLQVRERLVNHRAGVSMEPRVIIHNGEPYLATPIHQVGADHGSSRPNVKRYVSSASAAVLTSSAQKRRKLQGDDPSGSNIPRLSSPRAGPSTPSASTSTGVTMNRAIEVIDLSPQTGKRKRTQAQAQVAGPSGITRKQAPIRCSTPEVINIGSSDEDERLSPKHKKIRDRSLSIESLTEMPLPSTPTPFNHSFSRSLPPVDTKPESDSESSDDEWDLNDATRWKPIENKNRLDNFDIANDIDFEHLSIKEEQSDGRSSPLNRMHPNMTKFNDWPPKRMSGPEEFLWDELKRSNLRWRPPIMTMLTASASSYMRPFSRDFPLDKLKIASSFKKAPGSIARVVQKGKYTAIASASIAGLPDSSDDEENPSIHYNRPGSLLIAGCNKVFTPSGHQRKHDMYAGNNVQSLKYYAVHDVKFAPTSDILVSSGADKTVKIWSLTDTETPDVDDTEAEYCPWKETHSYGFKTAPQELAFKSQQTGDSGPLVLAIGEKLLHIKSFARNADELTATSSASYLVMPLGSPHVVGSIAWGLGPTADRLYVSMEPTDLSKFNGMHKVFDIKSQKIIYSLQSYEAGDSLSLNASGTMLALSTRARENTHILRLFDVTRNLHKPTFSCSAFSPDEIYLAVARNDNHVHIYDLRYLTEGPLFDYTHSGESKVDVPTNTYGVVKVEWLHSEQTRRMVLVSGGEDGCVRLWDPSKSDIEGKNGQIIAEVNSDIAHFSVGNVWGGEHQLVVGDCSGEVTIFDRLCI
ncbi:WD40 repeat-like protein [Agrocybe pediades]|nr:WD40 repeat-like protein [Agrocybe pediades]